MTEKEEWKQTTNKGMQPCENLLAKSHNAHSCENPHKRSTTTLVPPIRFFSTRRAGKDDVMCQIIILSGGCSHKANSSHIAQP